MSKNNKSVTTYSKIQCIISSDYRFAAFADIHLQYANPSDLSGFPENTYRHGAKDFINALSIAQDLDVDFACIAGDLGINSSEHAQTDSIYDQCINESKFTKPIYCCKGNHDAGIAEDSWKNITSCDLSTYSIQHDNDIFVFLNMRTDTSITGCADAITTMPFWDKDIDDLENIIQSNPEKTVFLFMHFPLNSERPLYQFAGLQELQYPAGKNGHHVNADGSFANDGTAYRVNQYGFKLKNLNGVPWHNLQNTRILDILKAHNGKSIVFSGHSHYIFDIDNRSPRVNFSQVSKNVYTVHIPSLNYPRDKNLNSICSEYPILQPSQGYIVDVCKNCIVLNGYEFNQNLVEFDYNKPVRQYKIQL